MITKFTANSYGCLRSVELGLTPIHALIGPNDSGKSTLLRAMRTLSQFAGGVFYSRKGFPDAPWSELNRPFELWPPEPAPGRIGSLWLQAETPQGAYALSGTPVNELEPEEVTVVTRPSLAQGTVVTPISQTANFTKRSSVFELGELWIAFANGVDEKDLLKGASPNGGDEVGLVEGEGGA